MKKVLKRNRTQRKTEPRVLGALKRACAAVLDFFQKWAALVAPLFRTLFRRGKAKIRPVVRQVTNKVVAPVAAPYRKLPKGLRYLVMGSGGLLLTAVLILIIAGGVRGAKKRQQTLGVTDASQMNGLNLEADTTDGTLYQTTPTPGTDPIQAQNPTDDAAATDSVWIGDYVKKGESDDRIIEVQERLMELGYLDPDEPTEYFGSNTYDALKAFQRHNGLEEDGILGGDTYTLLLSGDAKEYVMQQGDYGDDVTYMQERLYELGYLAKGFITGNFVDKTSEAVLAFQEANDLKADGKVGSKTLEKLYSDDVKANFFELGDTSETIKKYQKRLIELDYLSSDYSATGKLDSTTAKAIKQFQTVNGLPRDGYLGPTTMETLDSSDAAEYSLSIGMSGSDVKKAQARLHELGYLAGSGTGYYGEATANAVKQFQKRNSLRVDGAIGEKTEDKLYSSSAKKAAATPTPTPKPTATPKATATPKTSSGTSVKATPTPKVTAPTGGGSASTSEGVETFISIAEGKIGKPYVRGAKGPNSFDCSGFVYWCLNQAGVRQAYMTSIMWRTCSKYQRITSMSSLKRGDVLVFSGSTSASGHVGIYLGGGKMIDASSSQGKVRISSTVLTGSYWKTHFLMAYRIWDD